MGLKFEFISFIACGFPKVNNYDRILVLGENKTSLKEHILNPEYRRFPEIMLIRRQGQNPKL